MRPNLDHIAIVTHSLRDTVAQFPSAFIRHAIEVHESEGTQEQYLTLPRSESPSVLVMEPVGDGPYARALAQRGPGLHHLGCVAADLDPAIDYLAEFGLLLHPISLKTYAQYVVWLCRPGVPFLLELVEATDLETAQYAPTVLELPCPIRHDHVGELIAGCSIRPSVDNRLHIVMGDIALDLNLAE